MALRGSIELHWHQKEPDVIPYDPNETVLDLMIRINTLTKCDQSCSGTWWIDDSKYRMIRECDMDKKVSELGISSALHYTWRIGGRPQAVHWADYIADSTINRMQRGVTWRPSITVTFRTWKPWTPNKRVDCTALRDLVFRNQFQNKWTNYWDKDVDTKYRFTGRSAQRSSVVLLELREDLVLSELDKIRYDVFGCNKSYYGGEMDSWQRYTTRFAVGCDYEATPDSITMTPWEPLRPNRWHAVVFLNTGIGGVGGRIPPMYDDHLIPFLPNDVSACQAACWTFLMHMKRLSVYHYRVGTIVCRGWVWPDRFDLAWDMSSRKPTTKKVRTK